ncbi:MAG: O-antigen ligase family protein [Balneolales bacterium]
MRNREINPQVMVMLAGMLISFYVVPHLMLLVCAILVIYALLGVKNSIEALTISFLIGYLNPGIFDYVPGVMALRWLILFAAFGRVLYTIMFSEKYIIPRPVNSLLYFSFICLTLTIAASFQPMISIVKIVMFTIGVFTVLMAFQLTAHQKEYWTSWFTTFYFFIVISSLPFIFMSIGYYNNQAGFQGILNQPQAYGIFLAPFTAYFSTKILLNEEITNISIIGMLLGWVSVFLTQARMAFLAVVLSLLILIVLKMIIGFPQAKRSKSILTYPVLTAACLMGIILVFNMNPIMDKFSGFIQKNYEFDELSDGFQQSRGFLIERSMENFNDNPIMGIGFGIDSRLIDRSSDQQIMGIPLGAPTEKGFLFSAILEEIGIIGTIFFLVFFLGVIKYAFRLPLSSKHGMFLGCLFVNIAEMVFFSFGGSGLFLWLLIGYSTLE